MASRQGVATGGGPGWCRGREAVSAARAAVTAPCPLEAATAVENDAARDSRGPVLHGAPFSRLLLCSRFPCVPRGGARGHVVTLLFWGAPSGHRPRRPRRWTSPASAGRPVSPALPSACYVTTPSFRFDDRHARGREAPARRGSDSRFLSDDGAEGPGRAPRPACVSSGAASAQALCPFLIGWFAFQSSGCESS